MLNTLPNRIFLKNYNISGFCFLPCHLDYPLIIIFRFNISVACDLWAPALTLRTIWLICFSINTNVFFDTGKNWILNFKLFSDFIRLKASYCYCIFSNFCAIFNVNYYVKKRFSFLKLFFYLKLMKDLQKK